MSTQNAKPIEISVVSAAKAPHLYRSRQFWEEKFRGLGLWPDFIARDTISRRFSPLIDVYFQPLQLLALSGSNPAHVVGVANSVPLRLVGDSDDLPDNGWDWALEASVVQRRNGVPQNTLCGLS